MVFLDNQCNLGGTKDINSNLGFLNREILREFSFLSFKDLERTRETMERFVWLVRLSKSHID